MGWVMRSCIYPVSATLDIRASFVCALCCVCLEAEEVRGFALHMLTAPGTKVWMCLRCKAVISCKFETSCKVVCVD